jgi:hypothetical protein
VLVVVAIEVAGPARAVAASPPGAPPTTAPAGASAPDIVPRPDSGREPEDVGDPGGLAQLALAAGIALALIALATLALRDARRGRRVTARTDRSP